MTNSLENIDKKKLTMERLTDAMDDIFEDNKMQAMWKLYQGFINDDDSYDFSPVEQLEIQVFGTLYLRAAKALGAMDDESLIEEMRKQSSPFGRLSDMADRVDAIRKEAKKRADEKGGKNSLLDLDEVDYTGSNSEVEVSIKKKKREPPIDLSDLEEM